MSHAGVVAACGHPDLFCLLLRKTSARALRVAVEVICIVSSFPLACGNIAAANCPDICSLPPGEKVAASSGHQANLSHLALRSTGLLCLEVRWA